MCGLARSDLITTHEDYVKSFKASVPAVMKAARLLVLEFGLNITVPKLKTTPNKAERYKYVDDGDIIVHLDDRDYRIEVKQRFLKFTCADDFPYHTISLDEFYKANKENMYPLLAYMIVNQDMTYAAYVSAETRLQWIADVRSDSKRQRSNILWMTCPKELATYYKL